MSSRWWQSNNRGGRRRGRSRSRSPKASERHHWQNNDWPEQEEQRIGGSTEVAGVHLQIILDAVPVVELDTASVFHQNASWLLQTALDASGKADAIFEYTDDVEVLAECKRKLGLTAQDCFIVRLRRKDLQGIRAVGTNGKRAVMLASLVAYALHTEDNLDKMMPDVIKLDASLAEALHLLLKAAAQLAGFRWNHHSGAAGPAAQSRTGGNKKTENVWLHSKYDQRKDNSHKWWADDGPGPSRPAKQPSKAKACRVVADADELDEQLKGYFSQPADERRRRSSRRSQRREEQSGVKDEEGEELPDYD